MSDVAWRRSLYFVRARTFLYRHHRRRNRTRPVLPSSNRLVVKTFLVKLLFSLDLEAGNQPNPRRRDSRHRGHRSTALPRLRFHRETGVCIPTCSVSERAPAQRLAFWADRRAVRMTALIDLIHTWSRLRTFKQSLGTNEISPVACTRRKLDRSSRSSLQ